MKQRLSALFLMLIFLLMLFFPMPVFNGAKNGLLLWYTTVLPTLLPFMILASLMVNTAVLMYIARFFGPILHRVFGVSYNGSFAILVGFLCGYPMGAKVTADLVRAKRVSVSEGNYLLSFCNNTSPMFIISYLVWQNVKHREYLLPTLVILTLSPICCSFLFRSYWHKNCSFVHTQNTEVKSNSLSFKLFDQCLMNSIEGIVKVGGYIMLFCIIIELFLYFSEPNNPFYPLIAMLEITNGIPYILANAPSLTYGWILTMCLTSFGGVCAAFQTQCMIQDTGLHLYSYIIEKLITMLVTSLLAMLYLILPLHP